MPNWITNVVSFDATEEEVNEIKKAVNHPEQLQHLATGETEEHEQKFNFQVIKPQPRELDNTVHGGQNYSDDYKPDQNLIDKYGFDNWYDWRWHNWGTKWNAADAYWEENICVFDTAWATPEAIIIELSKMFPKVEITVQYADEDIGSNFGEYNVLNGEVIEEVNYGLQDLFNDPNAQYVALACKPYVDELVDFEKGCWKEDE
tara:strand:- start:255 stop:863 length:609 start_codon:yes stop_codon:yes gene_type:complete